MRDNNNGSSLHEFFEAFGVKITTTLLDRRGAGKRDIEGADLLYETENEKYILIQRKKEKNDGIVDVPREQLRLLLRHCQFAYCGRLNYLLNRILRRINGFCGAYYDIICLNGENSFFSACELSQIIGRRKSISATNLKNGLSEPTFVELFAKCKIGSPATGEIGEIEKILNLLLSRNRLLLHVQQPRLFEQKNN